MSAERELERKTSIKMLIQYSASTEVNAFTSIKELKRMIQKQFGIIQSDFNIFVKEYDVTSLDEMSLLKTLDYYRSNTIIISMEMQETFNKFSNPSILTNTNKYFKENFQNINNDNDEILNLNKSIQSQGNTPSERSLKQEQILKSKIDDVYSNINSLKKTINNLNYQKTCDASNINSQFLNSELATVNKKSLNSNCNILHNNSLAADNMKNNNSNLILNCSGMSISKNKRSQYINEEDTRMLREENENIFLTNKILNKSNMELKSQLKEYEFELENNRELRYKISSLNSIIENLRIELVNSEDSKKEIISLYENLKLKNLDIITENKILIDEIENINKNISLHERTNSEMKMNMSNYEDIFNSYENEKNIIFLQLHEKDKQIEKLNCKVEMLNELNEKINKSIQDYEDMFSNMKRTLEIFKNSSGECENEINKLKLLIDEKDEYLETNLKIIHDKDKQILLLNEENSFIKNQLNNLKNEINEKEKIISGISNETRAITSENEKLKLKNENLSRIVDDKDKTIYDIKESYAFLNVTLEHIKRDNENIKKTNSEDLNFIHKNRNFHKSKETIDNLTIELNKKSDEFFKYRENVQKNIIELENEISECKQKLNNNQHDIIALDRDLQERDEIIEILKNSVAALNKEKEKFSKDIFNLTNFLEKKEKDITDSKFTMNFYQNEIKNLNLLLEKKDGNTSEILKIKSEHENEIFRLQDRIKKYDSDRLLENDKYMKTLNDCNLINMELKSDNLKLNEEMKMKDKIISELLKKNESINQEILSLKDTKERTKKNYDNTIKEMKNCFSLMSHKEKELLSNIENLESDLKKREKEIKKYEQLLIDKDKNCKDIEKLNSDFQNANKEWKDKYEKIDHSWKTLNENYTSLKSTYENNLNITDEIRFNNQELSRQNSKIGSDNMLLKEKLDKLNCEYSLIMQNNTIKSDKFYIKTEILQQSSEKSVKPSNSINPLIIKPKTENNLQKHKLTKIVTKFLPAEYKENETNFKITPEVKINSDSHAHLEKTNLLSSEKKNLITSYEKINGAKYLYRVYDSKRILQFDLQSKTFKIIEFADYGYLENNFSAEGSIYLNTSSGLFIVTGDNHDMLFHFSPSKCSLNKLCRLNDNHSYGSLILDEKHKNLICISGWHNRKVEKYVNDELITTYFELDKSNNDVITINRNPAYKNNSWSYLPEMTCERSETSCIIVNSSVLYVFYGYCCPKMKFLDTIECLNLDHGGVGKTPYAWEILKFSNPRHLTTSIKSHSLLKINESEVLIIGGFDGKSELPIEKFMKFNFEKSELDMIDRKLPNIIFNHFYNFHKDSFFVPFFDSFNRLNYGVIDEMENAHLVEVSSFQYDVIKFD